MLPRVQASLLCAHLGHTASVRLVHASLQRPAKRVLGAALMAASMASMGVAAFSTSTKASAPPSTSTSDEDSSSSSQKNKTFTQNFATDVFAATRGGVEVRGAIWQIPHDEKRGKGGEDTYVLQRSLKSFAVFDGVGGWAESGVDPRQYALALATACAQQPESDTSLDPVALLSSAYARVVSEKVIGSCTATVATLDDKGILRVAQLGDSGLLVVRDKKSLVLRTKEQQHVFNMPYQLGTQSSDRPQHSARYEAQLQLGDTVLLATDGVFDNLDDKAILEILTSAEHARSQPQAQARAVSEAAYKVSKDSRAITPFTRHAMEQIRQRWIGGKEDDVTVLIVHYGHAYAAL